MENSSDKYLHKKFKKQLSIESRNQNNAFQGKTAVPITSEQNETQTKSEASKQFHLTSEEPPQTDNNKSVPNHSTNQNILPVLNPFYASSLYRSSISIVEEPSDISKELTTNPQLTNNSISYMISKTSRASPNQNDTHIKTVNFDTRFNVNEPAVVQSSSILENTSCKPIYVSSKLVNVKKDDQPEKEFSRISEKQPKQQEIHEGIPLPDKTTGGKHVCPYCNLACSKPSVLQKHIRAHTNERPYPCDSCGFSFKTRSNLYKHCRSRTHANRVMGNKVQEINTNSDMEIDNKTDYNEQYDDVISRSEENTVESLTQEQKSKPYKPRFHTAKVFFDNVAKENVSIYNEKATEMQQNPKHTNSDLLSLHINELINKNNSIVNSTDPFLLRKKSVDSSASENNSYDSKTSEEPLNLTNKNRKRCMSEVMEPTAQKSLIKELLLKNLYADTNMQCPYCKMLFQTVTELELHKLRSCKGFTKTGARYSRSSSVNVASILTQNKNAFDNIPHIQNTVFPLKSPGPFLGKTSLVESDKTKSFSFEDVLPTSFHNLHSTSDLLKAKYSLMDYDREKKVPIKLFGGELKITQTTGETKNFKFNAKDNDKFGRESNYNYINYGGKVSENRVVKSSLQSGGTVLTNKSGGFSEQDARMSSPEVIRVYEGNAGSPSRRSLEAEQTTSKQGYETQEETNGSASVSNKYTNIVDFSQKAVKLLAPNLKKLNLSIPGIPVPNKSVLPRSPLYIDTKPEKLYEPPESGPVNHHYTRNDPEPPETEKHLARQTVQKTTPAEPLPLCNPMNLYVNGKVVRYVPGMPGPVIAESSLEIGSPSNIVATNRAIPPGVRIQTPNLAFSPLEPIPQSPGKKLPAVVEHSFGRITKTPEVKVPVHQSNLSADGFVDVQSKSPKMDTLEVQPEVFPPRLLERKSPKFSDMISPEKKPEMKSPSEPRKFARPNSLALKPSLAAVKQHHGLTPTMFNQILISPDTPRVAKKYNQHMLQGNCFSYLGLKSSTKSVYCTLNKTQPVYVPHFKKLSMYSEWRQQDNKPDRFYVSAYDSRQRHSRCTVAGNSSADLVVHSSYKYVAPEVSTNKSEEQKLAILGGYECNEDYTYVRGRGRGRFVCDQCGIRCKKPSMLKKHLRTHSNDRPYACNHCNFRFKTKGNLTKHMKSKAHNKNYTASGSSNSSNQHSGTQSSESETEDSGMDSSDESTRQQEHEAAYGLLSLSQKTTPSFSRTDLTSPANPTFYHRNTFSMPANLPDSGGFMNNEELLHVSKKNFAKNKFLDEQPVQNFNAKQFVELPKSVENSFNESDSADGLENVISTRPLTYPYTSLLASECANNKLVDSYEDVKIKSGFENKGELKSIKHFQVIQNYNNEHKVTNFAEIKSPLIITAYDKQNFDYKKSQELSSPKLMHRSPPIVKLNDNIIINENSENVPADLRKRKISVVETNYKPKIHRNENEVMDLSVRMAVVDNQYFSQKQNGVILDYTSENGHHFPFPRHSEIPKHPKVSSVDEEIRAVLKVQENAVNLSHHSSEENLCYVHEPPSPLPKECVFKPADYDNSAMETLAEIATKQVKLEKNSLAKNVASEFLKLVSKNEFSNDSIKDGSNFVSSNNELIVKSEENKRCTICFKSFSKPSQLRLHMNIHYLERPFRCDSCSVSFRTKGHLQKHERSASHHNKLSSSPALSTSEPRPFKCSDCNIAFRIHGHLAKHLRSKMHIMRLECLAKIPFGLYAELERSNSLLTEINTADGDQCLESLKTLAKKVFINDPNKLNQLVESTEIEENSS